MLTRLTSCFSLCVHECVVYVRPRARPHMFLCVCGGGVVRVGVCERACTMHAGTHAVGPAHVARVRAPMPPRALSCGRRWGAPPAGKVCARARAPARARGGSVCVTLTLTPPPPRARVCVCAPPARADMAAAAAMSFDTRSDGAGGEGTVVQHVSLTPVGDYPWALISSPITTACGGVAFADFLLEEGNGYVARNVAVIVAPASLDRTKGATWRVGGRVMTCWLGGGSLWVNGARVRDGPPDWGAGMARGETVRYVDATRMVSVVWRGREHDLAPLPAEWDASTYRFGVAVYRGNKMRLTGVSPAGAPRARARRACGNVSRARRRVCARAFCACPGVLWRCLAAAGVMRRLLTAPPLLARLTSRFLILYTSCVSHVPV